MQASRSFWWDCHKSFSSCLKSRFLRWKTTMKKLRIHSPESSKPLRLFPKSPGPKNLLYSRIQCWIFWKISTKIPKICNHFISTPEARPFPYQHPYISIHIHTSPSISSWFWSVILRSPSLRDIARSGTAMSNTSAALLVEPPILR